MIRTEILIGIVILLLSVTGCQEVEKQDAIKYDMTPGTTEVIVEGGGAFPDFLVGKWKGNKGKWGMVFESDGSLSKVRIALGSTMLLPGQKNVLHTKGGGEAVYIPGNWTVAYIPETHELVVRIIINYIRVEMGTSTLIGKHEYTLEGIVNEQEDLWEAAVSAYPEFERLPNRPEDLPYASEVVFTKVTGQDI